MTKQPVCAYSRRDLLAVKFFIFSIKKDGKNLFSVGMGRFFTGTYKICFFNGDKLFSYCRNKNVYLMNKINYLTYTPNCPYPYAKNIWYNDKKRFICSEFIQGETFKDRKHLIFWAKTVLKMACKAISKIEGGFLYYVQHGDAWYENVKWQGDRFTYIDLDRIGFWPALYDIIYGLTVAFNNEAFDIIEKELFNDINELFTLKGLNYNIAELDKYYSAFIKIWAKRDKCIAVKYISPFKRLGDEFAQSKKALTDFYDSIGDV